MVSSELVVVIRDTWVVSTSIYQLMFGVTLLLRSTRPPAKPQPRRLARLAVARKSEIFGMTRTLEPRVGRLSAGRRLRRREPPACSGALATPPGDRCLRRRASPHRETASPEPPFAPLTEIAAAPLNPTPNRTAPPGDGPGCLRWRAAGLRLPRSRSQGSRDRSLTPPQPRRRVAAEHRKTVRAACGSGLPGCDFQGPGREARGTRTASRQPASSTGNLLISEQPARGAGDLARSLTALPFASEGSLRSPSRLAGRRPARGARRPQRILCVSLPVYKRLIPPFTRVYKRSVGCRLRDSLPRSLGGSSMYRPQSVCKRGSDGVCP